ncbi:MAG: MBL fold metallo-hydrolase [Deltaproteobacteria bacterium]|nr:MBL fold metallo-hydrolase [Deltaproteobacteria bacterium]
MKIKQFRYVEDNLAYLIYDEKHGVAVDPGAVNDILAFLKKSDIKLEYVINTHTHPDHTSGNAAIIKKTGAEYIDMNALIKKNFLELSGNRIDVHHTPGHSEDSVIFHFDNILVAGDTLFTGKAGKCFTGDLKRFLASIKLIMSFPDDTVIYSGHDYVTEYMETAQTIEPDNSAIEEFMTQYNPGHVYSTLADEYRMNPTLRFNNHQLIEVLKDKGLPVATEYDRWRSVMSIV